MSVTPSGFELAGKRFRVWQGAERPYRKLFERPGGSRGVIVGASHPAEAAISEHLEWTLDDWSAGEGFPFLNVEEKHPSLRGYFESEGAFDVSVPGQLRAGPAVHNSYTETVTVTAGPYLVSSAGRAWMVFNQKTLDETAADTWTERVDGLTSDVVGQIAGYANYIYIGGADGVRRVSGGANALMVSAGHRSLLVADSRLYMLARQTANSKFEHTALTGTFPLTPTLDGTFDGVGTDHGTSTPVAQVAVGEIIYSLVAETNGDPRLFVFNHPDNTALHEVASLEGLRTSAAEPGLQMMAAVNGVVFIGGWNADDNGGEVRFWDGQELGTIGEIRSNPGQSSAKVTCLARGRANELLIGTSLGLFRYDVRTGGLSLVAKPTVTVKAMTSALYHKGKYYFAYTTGSPFPDRVRVDVATLSGAVTTAERLTGPIWDFGAPSAEKLLTEIEVHSKTLGTDSVITIDYALDDGSFIGVHQHSTGARSSFVPSSPGTERIFRYMTPRITVDPGESAGAATQHTLYSVTFRALLLPTVTGFEIWADCSDEQPTSRRTGRSLSGRALLAELETLVSSTSDRVMSFKPLFEDSGRPHPHPDATAHTVVIADAEYVGFAPGRGAYRIRMRKL